MADSSICLAAIKQNVERKGFCLVEFATVEHILGVNALDGDQLFVDALDAGNASIDWITSYEIDWLFRRVLFRGPVV